MTFREFIEALYEIRHSWRSSEETMPDLSNVLRRGWRHVPNAKWLAHVLNADELDVLRAYAVLVEEGELTPADFLSD